MWDRQIPELTRHWRVLRFDLPGHGGAPPLPTATVGELADRLLATLDQLGIERFGYAGCCIGGTLGADLALRQPQRLASLALVGSAARFGPAEGWGVRASEARAHGLGPAARSAPEGWFTPAFAAAQPAIVDWAVQMVRTTDVPSYAAACEALAAFDIRAGLDRIGVPTLVLVGAEDQVTPPADARVLVAGIHDARLAVVPNTRHLAPVEQPAAVTDLLVRHFTATQPPVPPRTGGSAQPPPSAVMPTALLTPPPAPGAPTAPGGTGELGGAYSVPGARGATGAEGGPVVPGAAAGPGLPDMSGAQGAPGAPAAFGADGASGMPSAVSGAPDAAAPSASSFVGGPPVGWPPGGSAPAGPFAGGLASEPAPEGSGPGGHAPVPPPAGVFGPPPVTGVPGPAAPGDDQAQAGPPVFPSHGPAPTTPGRIRPAVPDDGSAVPASEATALLGITPARTGTRPPTPQGPSGPVAEAFGPAPAGPGADQPRTPASYEAPVVPAPEATAREDAEADAYRRGMRLRRHVLGDAHVDRAEADKDGFTADFQDFVTRSAWGETWARPGLDPRTRSLLTLTALTVGGHLEELALHTRAALRLGVTPDEIRETLQHTALYCGLPAASAAFAVARRTVTEEAERTEPRERQA